MQVAAWRGWGGKAIGRGDGAQEEEEEAGEEEEARRILLHGSGWTTNPAEG